MIDWLRRIVTHPRTERIVTALIVLNAAILGLETSARVEQAVGPLLDALDRIILAVFVVEIAARIVVFRGHFFRDPWSIFDFIVVGIALVPATEAFSVLRALRVLRVLRLITVLPSLRRVVGGLIAAVANRRQEGIDVQMRLAARYLPDVAKRKIGKPEEGGSGGGTDPDRG